MKAWFGVIALLAAACIGLEYGLTHSLRMSLVDAILSAPVVSTVALLLLLAALLVTIRDGDASKSTGVSKDQLARPSLRRLSGSA